jgi:voltage-gated potassium channel
MQFHRPLRTDRPGIRAWVYCQLEPAAWRRNGLSPLNKALFVLISGAVLAAILETEPLVADGHDRLFDGLEWVLGVLFSVEYLARLWVAPENPKYNRYRWAWQARVRYMVSPAAIIDLFAILVSVFTINGVKPFVLRIFRLMRILRLIKLGRMSMAMGYLIEAITARRVELLFSFFVGLFFLILSASALYVVEGEVQPDKFGSIPRAMWWATATLTTIGYGDVYPITTLGKICAACSAIAGIGLVAMPTGIMAAAFSEAVQRHSTAKDEPPEE